VPDASYYVVYCQTVPDAGLVGGPNVVIWIFTLQHRACASLKLVNVPQQEISSLLTRVVLHYWTCCSTSWLNQVTVRQRLRLLAINCIMPANALSILLDTVYISRHREVCGDCITSHPVRVQGLILDINRVTSPIWRANDRIIRQREQTILSGRPKQESAGLSALPELHLR
jgi:hypothetical protein